LPAGPDRTYLAKQRIQKARERLMLSTIVTYGLVAGTAALAIVGTIFVVVMNRRRTDQKILGWQKIVLHPAPYLRFAGISYLVAAVAFVTDLIL